MRSVQKSLLSQATGEVGSGRLAPKGPYLILWHSIEPNLLPTERVTEFQDLFEASFLVLGHSDWPDNGHC